MTAVRPNLKWYRQLRSPIAIAFLLSLLLHLYVWLMAMLLRSALQNGWLPPWMERAVQPVAALLQPSPPTNAPVQPTQPRESWEEIPLQFVEVDPALVTDDAPDDAPLFSTANTRAANPNPPEVDTGKVRVDGWREDSNKTFDTPRPAEKPTPPQAKAPEPEVAQEQTTPKPAQEAKPKVEAVPAQPAPKVEPTPTPAPTAVTPPEPKGETQLAKADPKAAPPVPQPQAPSPTQPPRVEQKPQEAQPEQAARPPRQFKKRLADVLPTKGALVGERMKQEGGVLRPSIEPSLNVKASPLGDYHHMLVLRVQQRWYQLLEERRFARERLGKVVIKFDLHSDGTITGLEIKNSDVGEVLSLLCDLSLTQSAPFGRWPPEIRRLIGGDVIPMTFTFNYY